MKVDPTSSRVDVIIHGPKPGDPMAVSFPIISGIASHQGPISGMDGASSSLWRPWTWVLRCCRPLIGAWYPLYFIFLDSVLFLGFPHLSLSGFMDMFNDTSVLAWNIRGAKSQHAQRNLREILRRFHPSILIIMETHTSFANTSGFWNRVNYQSISVIEATGHACGLWVLALIGLPTSVSVIDIGMHSITFSISLGGQLGRVQGCMPTLYTPKGCPHGITFLIYLTLSLIAGLL